MRTYIVDGVEHREEEVPHMYVVIDTYHPSSTITPWDYYGMKHQREYGRVLKAAGIEFCTCNIHKTILHPVGTGPNGAVRFGDNMTLGVYRIAVSKYDVEKAEAAIKLHKLEVYEWIHNNGKMPEACS